jgi:hypothetical protein
MGNVTIAMPPLPIYNEQYIIFKPPLSNRDPGKNKFKFCKRIYSVKTYSVRREGVWGTGNKKPLTWRGFEITF